MILTDKIQIHESTNSHSQYYGTYSPLTLCDGTKLPSNLYHGIAFNGTKTPHKTVLRYSIQRNKTPFKPVLRYSVQRTKLPSNLYYGTVFNGTNLPPLNLYNGTNHKLYYDTIQI